MSVRRCFNSVRLGRARTRASSSLEEAQSLLRTQGIGELFLNRLLRHLSTLVEYQQEALTSTKWKVVRRPVLDMELRRYAQSPVVPQALILHGPRGVGKRTTIEGLLLEWRRSPHAVAYVDLYAEDGASAEGYRAPPWTLSHSSSTSNDLGWIRQKLEQGLESLALEAVQVGCLKGKNVFDVLVDQHAIGGALSQFLQARTTGKGELSEASSGRGETKHLWQEALRHMRRAAAGFPGHLGNGTAPAGIAEILRRVLENTDTGSLDTILPQEVGRNIFRNQKGLDGQSEMKEKAVLSLALAKHLLRIQEEWRHAAGSDQRSRGLIPKGLVDAAISWPMLLFQLVSWATQEGLFQPKLVINGLEVVRNAPVAVGGLDGAAYHDGLLLRLVNTSVSQGSFPTILVSSDSYYSWQLGDDFGNTDAFISSESFGWTSKEAALHIVPGVFSADEWKVVAAVLGTNPRHLVELQSIWHSKAYSERMKEDDSLDMEDCIDLYLAYLQVTAVDPAMDAAIGLLEQFADKARKGGVDNQLLQHGAPWRTLPRTKDTTKRRQWAKLQLMDFIQALANTEFGVNYLGGELEFLDDPAARALVQVGLLYQQRASPYARPTSRGILRCLTRWFVREKLRLSLLEKIRFKWHRVIRGRYYRHLMLDS